VRSDKAEKVSWNAPKREKEGATQRQGHTGAKEEKSVGIRRKMERRCLDQGTKQMHRPKAALSDGAEDGEGKGIRDAQLSRLKKAKNDEHEGPRRQPQGTRYAVRKRPRVTTWTAGQREKEREEKGTTSTRAALLRPANTKKSNECEYRRRVGKWKTEGRKRRPSGEQTSQRKPGREQEEEGVVGTKQRRI